VYFGQKMKLRSGSKDGQEKKIALPGEHGPDSAMDFPRIVSNGLETEC